MKQEYLLPLVIAFLFTLFSFSIFLLSNKIKQSHIKYFHLFLLSVIYIVFVIICWNRFMNLNSDWGKELSEPLKLLSGGKLYTDIYWPYGPLAPYINMFIYKLFGVHLIAIEAIALSLNLILLLLTYWLSVNIMQPKFAFLAAYLSFATSIVSKHNLMPYTFSSLYAAIFSSLTLILIIKHLRKKRIYPLVLAAISTGLTLVAKPSMGILLLISCAIFLLIAKNNSKNMLIFFLSFLIITIIGYGSFALTTPWEQLKEQLFLPSYVTKGYYDTALPDTLRLITLKYSVSAPGATAFPFPVALYFAGLYWIPFLAAIVVAYNIIYSIIQKNLKLDFKILLLLIYFFIGNIQSVSWVHLLFLGFVLWPLTFIAANLNKKNNVLTITFLLCYAFLGLSANSFTFLKRNTVVNTNFGNFLAEPEIAQGVTTTLNLLNKYKIPENKLLIFEDAMALYPLYNRYNPVQIGIPFWHIIQTKEQQADYIKTIEKQKITYILAPGWDSIGRDMNLIYPWLYEYINKYYEPIESIKMPKWNNLTLFTTR